MHCLKCFILIAFNPQGEDPEGQRPQDLGRSPSTHSLQPLLLPSWEGLSPGAQLLETRIVPTLDLATHRAFLSLEALSGLQAGALLPVALNPS